MDDWLAARFEENRGRLRAMAYRMLGSLSEADDAVEETWLRVSRAGASGVENPDGWLTTVAARVCLNMLREPRARRDEPLSGRVGRRADRLTTVQTDPEHEAPPADPVGLALMLVLDT